MLAPRKGLKLVRVLIAASTVVVFGWASHGCAEGGEATKARGGSGGRPDGSAGSVDSGGKAGNPDAGDAGPAVCGNGVAEPGEYCDDGNQDETDGCKSDCSQSCMPGAAGDQSCTDYVFCNGEEICEPTTSSCGPGTAMPDGSPCGQNKHCQNGVCEDTPVVCGDGLIVSPQEECDDGNTFDDDGCDANCLWTCESMDQDACAPPDPCQQNGTCNDITHRCTPGQTLPDGIDCDAGKVCRGGVCTTVTCGNGRPDPGEECDDMNTTPGDGCENGCRFSCVSTDTTRNCAIADPCGGTSTCNNTTHRCSTPTPLPANASCGTGRYCKAGVCTLAVCGNSTVEPGEDCDEGQQNPPDDRDGCKVDCKFSCRTAADCNDSNPCTNNNCGADHKCANPPNTGINGQVCTQGTTTGTCQNGVCVPAACGNTYLDAGEECDNGPGGQGPGKGCDLSCQFECDGDANCNDANQCNGTETCQTITGGRTCRTGTPPAVNSPCGSGAPSICNSNRVCVASVCGDNFVDTRLSEECDDGNTTNADGCDNDCKFSCPTKSNCSDTNTCNQDVCNSSHVCTHPADTAKNGQSCTPPVGGNGNCQNGTCVPSNCGNSVVEAGEQCDRGSSNGAAGSGCTTGCQFKCQDNSNCSDNNPCTGNETCDNVTGGGKECSNPADLAQGAVCATTPDRKICNAAKVCVLTTCGDSWLDNTNGGTEQCDNGPGGQGAGTGCTTSCQFECQGGDCENGNLCDGTRTCVTVSGGKTCQTTTQPPAAGTVCLASPRSICQNQQCNASTCGDGFVDPGATPAEQCDNGGGGQTPGSGCAPGCQFECQNNTNCEDGNICNGTRTCVTVTGGKTCQTTTGPPPNGTNCNASPRRICISQSCATSACGDGFVDTAGNGGTEQCEPPNTASCSATCQGITTCNLAGRWGIKVTTNVSWNGNGPLNAGSGITLSWARIDRTHTGNSTMETNTPCGVTVPDFSANILFSTENFGLTFPSLIFDSNVLGTATVPGTLSGSTAGSTFTTPATANLVGLVAFPNATTAAMPDITAIQTFLRDHDALPAGNPGAGNPGVTALVKTGGSYDLIRVCSTCFPAIRADRLHVAVRQVVALSGALDSCTQISGTAFTTKQDSRVLSCRLASGGTCNESQRAFLDSHAPAYLPGTATFLMRKISNTGTCADVRGAVP